MKITYHIDESVLLRFRDGDVNAFKLLYESNKVMLFANILKFVKDDDLAADILQDVFIEIWNNRHRFDVNQPLKGLLFYIAKNKIYDHFRKVANNSKLRDKLILINSNVEYSLIEEDYIQNEDICILHKEIEQLPEKCKEVFKLCKLEGKSYQEAADLLNISTATINNHIVKGTNILRTRLKNHPQFYAIALFYFI